MAKSQRATIWTRAGAGVILIGALRSGGVAVKSIDRNDLDSVPVLVSEEGFPGELSPTDAARARRLIRASEAEAVLVAVGAGGYWWCRRASSIRLAPGAPMRW